MTNLLLIFSLFIFNPKKVMIGTWVSAIDGRKLTIHIEKVKGDKLVGWNQLGGTKRPISGIFYETEWDQPCSKAYEAVLKEPGDDRFDGVFTIKFVGYEDQKGNDCGVFCLGNLKGVEAYGEWKSYKGKKKNEFFLIKKD